MISTLNAVLGSVVDGDIKFKVRNVKTDLTDSDVNNMLDDVISSYCIHDDGQIADYKISAYLYKEEISYKKYTAENTN